MKRAGAVVSVVLVAGLGMSSAGCGGGDHTPRKPDAQRPGADELERAQKQALHKLPAGDRFAFFKLAAASGVLRLNTARLAIGKGDRLGPRRDLVAARRQVLSLAPRHSDLVGAQRRLAAALGAAAEAPRSGPRARSAARTAIAATDVVNARLIRYSRMHPAVAAGVPD